MPLQPNEVNIHAQDVRWKDHVTSYEALIKKAVAAACEIVTSAQPYEISVVLTNDETIAEMNHTYRGKEAATNVLSFPDEDAEYVTGDIILAFETIQKEASDQNKTLSDHALHMLVHGVLHVVGYDHIEEEEADIMEGEEVKILKTLGINNPYL